MSEAPETIWAWRFKGALRNDVMRGGWNNKPDRRVTEYRRADLPPTLSAAMELPEVRALVGYVSHNRNCDMMSAFVQGNTCTCGLLAALAPFTEAKP